MTQGVETPDFFALDDALAAAGAAFRAADAHGFLCGLACARRQVSEEDWRREVLGSGVASELPSAQCCELLSALFGQTMAQLTSSEQIVVVLSPADEYPLRYRAEALKSWCQGFLYGLGLGVTGNSSSLPSQVREIVNDLAEITRLDEKTADNEPNEAAYAELVEYVRVAVTLVKEELDGSPPRGVAAVMLGEH